mmetsp:Transcript_15240/g.51440  ORF Transcript_15240/g.51440 Transcript_15240/m.51440 type:complete len:246 (+) Transcript_15240:73-810(+)
MCGKKKELGYQVSRIPPTIASVERVYTRRDLCQLDGDAHQRSDTEALISRPTWVPDVDHWTTRDDSPRASLVTETPRGSDTEAGSSCVPPAAAVPSVCARNLSASARAPRRTVSACCKNTCAVASPPGATANSTRTVGLGSTLQRPTVASPAGPPPRRATRTRSPATTSLRYLTLPSAMRTYEWTGPALQRKGRGGTKPHSTVSPCTKARALAEDPTRQPSSFRSSRVKSSATRSATPPSRTATT